MEMCAHAKSQANSVFFSEGQRSALACHSFQCGAVCACVGGGAQLIQVLSRRKDKNLLPACSLVGTLNLPTGEEVDPNNPQPVCLIAETPFPQRQKTTCGREGAGFDLKLHKLLQTLNKLKFDRLIQLV